MKKIKQIYLPESECVEVQQAIASHSNEEVQLLNHLEINPMWFAQERIDINQLDFHQQRLINGFLALKNNVIDGLIVGLTYPSKDVFKCAIKYLNPNKQILSSCFVVREDDRESIWGDCAFNIEPDLEHAQANIQAMIELGFILQFPTIRVGLLSYSTLESGSGETINKIHELSVSLQAKYQHLSNVLISDNLQFDAAMKREIAAKKQIEFYDPNILWFPNLFAGNIGYKIAQHYNPQLSFGGPLILGTDYCVSDLSRGASLVDIQTTIAVMIKWLTTKKGASGLK